jgi:predicted negative regulator of RcsB-dependent stress response
MDVTSKYLTVTTIIQDYGFPIVAVFFLAYFIWFLWKYITNEITPKLNSTSATLIKLIDRVRMLDNDLIRLETKVRTFRNSKKK